MTAQTITARVAAHQRARILRDAARHIPSANTIHYWQNVRTCVAAARQEAIGNGKATR